MAKLIRVGVVFGGQSSEHEVSLVSATTIITNLDQAKYQIVEIGITPTGEWISGPETLNNFKQRNYDVSKNQTNQILQNLVTNQDKIDIIFPVLHGTFGEDGHLQGLFNIIDIPIVGCDTVGSAIAFDKVIAKQLCQQNNIPVVDYDWFYHDRWLSEKDNILERLEKKLGFSMFVKPANLGSSVGINKAHNKSELVDAVEEGFKYDYKLLIEKSMEDYWEIETSVLGNFDPRVSISGRVVPKHEFYDYEAKYVDDSTKTVIPSGLDKDLEEKVQTLARSSFLALNLKGLARIDFFVDPESKKIYLNEANSMPGFTSISMYPKLWQASGIKFNQLLDKLIELGLSYYQTKQNLETTYETTDWFKKE